MDEKWLSQLYRGFLRPSLLPIAIMAGGAAALVSLWALLMIGISLSVSYYWIDNMSYPAKPYAYIFVANVLAVVIVKRWGRLAFWQARRSFLVYAYLTILVRRNVLGRNCESVD